jgi:tRNA 2-thiouridine synthesizing protein A
VDTGKPNEIAASLDAESSIKKVQVLPDLEINKELDTRGLTCPLPILRTKKGLTDMLSGQILKVMATDPGAVRDFEAFARQTGNTLVHADTAGPEFIFYLKKR